jgi:hypothetical protein
MANSPSLKKIQINKATRTMLIVIAVASFISIFALIASHSLITVLNYQNRVISAKSTALNQLNTDVTTSKKLIVSYNNFNNQNPNILGSPITGTGQNDGNNAKIVLDSLPSVYDFPALVTSIQSLLSNQGVTISSISGSDLGTTSSSSTTTASTAGGATAMPFTFTVTGPYQNIQSVINTLQNSIRPFQIMTMSLSGDQSNISLTVSAQTFYQPAISFNITKKAVN